MHKFIKVVGYTVATAGLAYVLKQIMQKKEHRSDWHKIKVEEEKPKETESNKTKEEEKRTGSRYGSNPVKY
ncbi:MAG: hypothetical protein NHB15_02235 [Methanosarcina barkeri]|nr:hypothetical protein [Methanosarcina sp. ERenArc_MAG2]